MNINNRIENIIEKHFNKIYIIIVLFAAVQYFTLVGGKFIWFDEAYSLAMAENSIVDICKITAADVHPPMYYILLKIFIYMWPNKVIAARAFSALTMFILVIVGGYQISKLFSKKTGVTFMIVLTSFSALTGYAIELRMYSMAALFVTLTGIYAYRCYEKSKTRDWVLFVIFGVCSAYTHYFAFMSICYIYGLLFIMIVLKKREVLKAWLISVVISIIMYIPWIKFFVGQLFVKATTTYWIPSITIKTLISDYLTIFDVNGMRLYPIYVCPVYIFLLLVIITSNDKRKKTVSLCAVSIPLLTMITGIVISIVMRPVYVVRFLIPSIPLMLIFISIALCELEYENVYVAIMSLVIISGTLDYESRLGLEYKITENIIDEDFETRYEDLQEWYISTVSSQFMGICAYFGSEHNIYFKETKTDDIPFKNYKCISEFDIDNVDKFLLVKEHYTPIPDGLDEYYDYEFQETVSMFKVPADVFILTKKSNR